MILLSKTQTFNESTKVLLKSIVWQNQYYQLGRLCNNVECLLNRPEDLSGVTLGKDSFEDSLLLTGWSSKESVNRWAQGKESTLRLAVKDTNYRRISFEALTLSEPQSITVYFDEKLLGTKSLSTQWQQYEFLLPKKISKNVYRIRFTYSHTYKPSEVLNSTDTRDLAVNFRWVKLLQN